MTNTGSRSELITIGDLKNWGYCPRVVYYRRFLPGASTPTYKMKAGIEAQAHIESLEVRRTLSRYGWEGARRKFGLRLADAELGLSGKLDILLERETEAAIVDFKLTSGDPGRNHRLQLGGYGLIVERQLGLAVRMAFLVRIPDSRIFEIPIDDDLRTELHAAIREINHMVDTEECPQPTDLRSRCVDCEYANFCADVW